MYLLGTAILSFVLPFMQFDVISEQIPSVFRMELPAVFIGNGNPEVANVVQSLDPVLITQSSVDWPAVLLIIYGVGVTVAVLVFLLKLQKLAVIRKSSHLSKTLGYRIYEIPNSTEAFTFLRTMYLGATISEDKKEHIIAHEKVHIDQWHSLDLLFFEVLKALFWFNPMVYIYQKQLQSLHEFAADKTVAEQDKSAYYQNLLSQVFGTTSISFINTFFNQSLIKKRIIMLQKSKSNRVSALKYLLVIPFIAGMLVYTSCANDTAEISSTVNSTAEGDTEVMQKINELSEAIMKVGNISDEEMKALEFLAAEAKPGDKIYHSVDEYLTDVNEEGVPLSTLDTFPVYPGCEGDNDEVKKCFSESITKFIGNNFNTKLGDDSNISGKQRIVANFSINKIGLVQDIKIISDYEALSNEALRVVRLLPKMKPGMKDNKTVNVLYSLPILFNIEE
ncbi:TonB [unidentified eubacterium SCB49]|nr:TonB [unidentified eubacterium SCB49]